MSPAGPPGASRPTALHRLERVASLVEIGVASAAAALIFVLVLIQAGQRYLPVDGWTWTGELARYGLVWLTFAIAGLLVTRDGHISLQLVDNVPSEAVVRTVRVLALLVVAACGVGYAVACWNLVRESGSLTTPAMGIPLRWIYVIPLLGFASTAVRATLAATVILRHGVPEVQHAPVAEAPAGGESGVGA